MWEYFNENAQCFAMIEVNAGFSNSHIFKDIFSAAHLHSYLKNGLFWKYI